MSKTIIEKIQESTTRDLQHLKKECKNTLTEVVIDQEIRVRMITETVRKLERDYANRKRKE